MAKAVFISSSHSPYDDRPGEVYHFPDRYLRRVSQTVGDWVVFYQGRRGGAVGYYALQRVARIEPDPVLPGHSYAVMDRGSLLDFEWRVPRFRADQTPYETGLPVSRGSNTAAVRLLSEADFAAIVWEGLREDHATDTLPRSGPLPGDAQYPGIAGLAESAAGWDPGSGTFRPQVLVSRSFRDRAFARLVKRAYAGRCAMSGLALRNGGGRPEVEAAHIVPVEAQGPDSVRNGLALSGTIHWMFDRGLVSVDTDHSILIAPGTVAEEIAGRLFVADRRLILPTDPAFAPHASYFKWHRDHVFKG